jgi:antitoxin component of RelBE/YafQ-DinJ toxin-antitoxin module
MKDTQLTIRINSDLKQQAQEHAENTGRTLAGLIEWLLKQELKKDAERQEGRKTMNALLSSEFIKTASFDELRKAAKENDYSLTNVKEQVFVDSVLGQSWENKMGYPKGTWLRKWEFYKTIADGNRLVKHFITVILEYAANELSMDDAGSLKSVKLFIDGSFVCNYANNIR